MSKKWLYRYEAKGIQSYIMASDRLKQIKGGSALIENLTDLAKEALNAQGNKGELVIAAAGSATIRFESEADAQDFAGHWPMLVESHTPGLQLIQACVEEGDNWYKELQQKLQADRQKLRADLPEATPRTQRAVRTGLPAVHISKKEVRYQVHSDGETLHDAATVARLWASRNRDEDSKRKIDPLWNRLLEGEGQELAKQFPGGAIDDASEFPEKSYLAVIHIDGNDMGQLFLKLTQDAAVEEIASISRALSQATEEAARAAFLEASKLLPPSRKPSGERKFPGRVVVLGGDDFTGILRADLAIPFVETYLQAFEQSTNDAFKKLEPMLSRAGIQAKLPKNVAASAGIAFVRKTYPFHLALEMSESLCKFCKEQTRNYYEEDSHQQTPSGMAWYRISSGFSGGYQELLKERGELFAGQYVTDKKKEKFLLAGGPYLLHEIPEGQRNALMKDRSYITIAQVNELREKMKQLPNSALREAVNYMCQSLELADERIARLRQVMQDRGQAKQRSWDDFERILKEMNCTSLERNGRTLQMPLWRLYSSQSGELTYGTPLYDLITWKHVG